MLVYVYYITLIIIIIIIIIIIYTIRFAPLSRSLIITTEKINTVQEPLLNKKIF
jgi:hypothetical protein